jgi:N-acetylglucosamine-6-phosphate deacetylase
VKNLILKNGIILTPSEQFRNRILFLKHGKIEKIIHKQEFDKYTEDYIKSYNIIDVNGNYISPGFIDIHTHGANNVDAVKDNIETMGELKVRYGTTGFLPTLWTAEFDRMITACRRITESMGKKRQGSRILGINSEGPYLNPNLGAQKRELVKIPKYEDYKRLFEASEGNLKIMTIAPELEGADGLIRYLRQNNVVISIGHTDIKREKVNYALNLGITLITHMFDAMGESIRGEPGTKALGLQEELLISDDLMSEVISDKNGVHVKPTWLNILVRCKGVNNIILITDSMNMTGAPPGKYYLQDGRAVIIKEGEDIVRLAEGGLKGGLAGSVMTMDMAIRNIINHTGVSIKDAVRMASYNPSRVIKMHARKGEIKEGMDADIAVFDKNINVKLTIVEGEIAYNNCDFKTR